MNKTNFVENLELRKNFKQSIEKINRNLNSIERALTEDGINLTKGSYHLLTRILEPTTSFDRVLYSHLLRMVYNCELMGAGAGFISLLTFLKYSEKFLKEDNDYCIVDSYHQRETGGTNKYKSHHVTYEFIKKVITKTVENEKLSSCICEAIKLAGMEGNIHVENSDHTVYSVELKYGYHFNVKPFKFMIPAFGTWESYDCKMLCVDGFVEKVSELDKILTKSFQTKIPLIIVAQGFSEEVVSTVVTNNNAKRFNVLLVRLEQELENINVLNDIAVVSGGDIVSVLKGDMLIYVDYDVLPIVDNVKCNDKELIVTNSSTRGAVASQIKSLLEKRNEQLKNISSGFNVGNLTTKRISNLLSHSVSIKLPIMTTSESTNAKTKIDIVLRTVKSLVTYGYIDLKEEMEKVKDPIVKSVLKERVTDVISTLSLYAGLQFGKNTAIEISKVAGAVIVEN